MKRLNTYVEEAKFEWAIRGAPILVYFSPRRGVFVRAEGTKLVDIDAEPVAEIRRNKFKYTALWRWRKYPGLHLVIFAREGRWYRYLPSRRVEVLV